MGNMSGGVAMDISKYGLAEITSYEGVCTAPYLDSGGVWTFGIGHTRFDGIKPIPEHMERGRDLSIEFCFELFQKTIQKYVDGVNKVLTVKVNQAQFDALVSFHYNTGKIGSSTLIKRINAGAKLGMIPIHLLSEKLDNNVLYARTNRNANYTESTIIEFNSGSISDAFRMWVKDNGRTVRGLVIRREREANLYTSGLYSGNGEALVSTANVYGKEYGARSMNIMEYIKC
jgi:GH24 family phage-related lysozyme (muramidase)